MYYMYIYIYIYIYIYMYVMYMYMYIHKCMCMNMLLFEPISILTLRVPVLHESAVYHRVIVAALAKKPGPKKNM